MHMSEFVDDIHVLHVNAINVNCLALADLTRSGGMIWRCVYMRLNATVRKHVPAPVQRSKLVKVFLCYICPDVGEAIQRSWLAALVG